MPSGPVDEASDGHAYIFSPPAEGPGGGTGSGGRGLPQDRQSCPEPEVERSPPPHMSPPSPPPHVTCAAVADTPYPSYTAQHSPGHIHVSSRELAAVMDAVCSLATTQAAQDQRLARAEATLGQCHSMLQADHDTYGYSACS